MTIETLKAIYRGDVISLEEIDAKEKLSNYVTQNEKWNWLHKALVSVTNIPPIESIITLIKLGVQTNCLDKYGNSPLHYAARLKSPELASALLDGGASVNQVNLKGVTPLRESLLRKPYNRELVKLFLSRGADVSIINNFGSSDIDYVKLIAHGEDADIIKLFI